MELSRRSFLKAAGLTLGLSMARLGLDMPAVQAAAKEFKLKNCQEFTSVCHFCACGCGMLQCIRRLYSRHASAADNRCAVGATAMFVCFLISQPISVFFISSGEAV